MQTDLTQQRRAPVVVTKHPLVLASASPRRSEILSQLGFVFEVVPPGIDEESVLERDLAELAKAIAEQKAFAISETHADRCVVAADTVVEFGDVSLGKPGSPAEATSMLVELSGKTHNVHTGVAVCVDGAMLSGVETTRVSMRNFSADEIESYVQSGAPMDKAGAYGIQDVEFSPVKSHDGSYLNVVGLPADLLAQLLLKAGEIDASAASLISRSDR